MIEREQWDSVWENSRLAQGWQRLEDNLKTPQQKLWVDFYLRHIPERAKVLEIGCAGSQLMPYIARHRQAEMWGIDYSPTGIKLSQEGFQAEEVVGNFVLGDALESNNLPKAYFDVVYSLGVIEHFKPAQNAAAMSKFASYLRPGGIMITLVPNMVGVIGLITRIFDRTLYNQHIPLDIAQLDQLHQEAGLLLDEPAQYVGVFNFYVVNTASLESQIGTLGFRAIRKFFHTFQESYIRFFPERESRSFSPYVIGVYRKSN